MATTAVSALRHPDAGTYRPHRENLGTFNEPNRETTLKSAAIAKAVSFSAFLILSAGSIWGVAESFHMTLSGRLPKPVGYLLGFALIALGSLALFLIRRSLKEGYVDNRPSSMVLGIIFFLLPAIALAIANSHNIFYLMVAPEIRQADSIRARDTIALVKDTTEIELKNSSQRMKARVGQLIEQLKAEIRNERNPGAGDASAATLQQLSEAIGEPIGFLTGRPTGRNGAIEYGDAMALHIQSVAEKKLERFPEIAATFQEKYEESKAEKIIQDLNDSANNASILEDAKAMTELLRQAKSVIGKLSDLSEQLLSDPIVKKYRQSEPKTFPMELVSEQLTYAPYVISSFVQGTLPPPLPGKYIWAFFIGVILDVGAFMFWFYGVLRNDEDE